MLQRGRSSLAIKLHAWLFSSSKTVSSAGSLHHEPNTKLARSLLKSPQLSLKSLPLLSSCLPPSALSSEDTSWIGENLPLIQQKLKYSSALTTSASLDSEDPLSHLETLVFLAFQHVDTERSKKAKYIRDGHSRLWFLGQYVLELALAEYFLLRYPRDLTALIRERISGLTDRRVLPQVTDAAGLKDMIFPSEGVLDTRAKLTVFRQVFCALLGVSFLSMGMPEVYRILFEVFGLDPEALHCQPRVRPRYQDEDNIFPALEKKKKMTWQDIITLTTADDPLFAKPLLFRACVPPGMRRFKGNLWEIESLPTVLRVLGYPLQFVDEEISIAATRNEELELGLQLCFCDPLAFKLEHPRFCNERFEFLGQKIQDLVMAELLVSKHLDSPGEWLREKHRRLLFNRVCGKYFREYKLHKHILYADVKEGEVFRSTNSQKIASIRVCQALHGLGYAMYGKGEVRRLMCEVFDFLRPKKTTKKVEE